MGCKRYPEVDDDCNTDQDNDITPLQASLKRLGDGKYLA
jgi:hypothetical protein